jgi:hypothetical protein
VTWNAESTVSVTAPEGAGSYQRVGEGKQPVAAGEPVEVGLLPVMFASQT